MKRSTFLSIAAVLGSLFGLGMLAAPEQFFSSWGITLDNVRALFGRNIGALLFSLGVINWFARNAADSDAMRAILIGNLTVQVITLVVDFLATSSGTINAQGWVGVGMHIMLGGGFAYYLFKKQSAT